MLPKCASPGAREATGARRSVRPRNQDRRKLTPPPLRLQVLSEHLHMLGPRALHEFIIEIALRFGPEIVDRLEAYGRIDPTVLRIMRGDRFPRRLAAIEGGRR